MGEFNVEYTYYDLYTRQMLTRHKEEKMGIVEKVKRLALSSDDRLLRDMEIVDRDGDVTDEGRRLVWGYLLEEYKSQLVEDLKKVKAEQDKECKKKK